MKSKYLVDSLGASHLSWCSNPHLKAFGVLLIHMAYDLYQLIFEPKVVAKRSIALLVLSKFSNVLAKYRLVLSVNS